MYYDDDVDIIQLVQGDIPLQSNPYQELADKLGISEEAVVERLKGMMDRGLIRRFGAVLRHQKAGFVLNAMVAWKATPGREDQAGNILAGYRQVTHCYLRDVPEEFGYNLFTMIHAHSEEELASLLACMVKDSGLQEYLVIRSIREFKKTSMQYLLKPGAYLGDSED
ncbi:MAG TPA: Lrp/AsnC family transcriptional regulator [Syntrophomonadaceae bacterium]|nr:Lrp/AsnC family transcriptional regulator [Syntrophomonadaceae bacterium]